MKLIIGLGNPGEKYRNNRHNVGYMLADKLKTKSLKLKGVIVVKTNTFMNESGSFVKKIISQYPDIPVSSVYVVHDDLDIPLGSYKIQFGKGPKVHRGLQSIEEVLGGDFWRVRVGIENRIKNNELRIKGEQYVLEDFTKEEEVILDKVIGKVCKEISHLRE